MPIAAQLLGFENLIPPFANTSGSDILKGVNYASGAAGIRVESGTHMVNQIIVLFLSLLVHLDLQLVFGRWLEDLCFNAHVMHATKLVLNNAGC